MAAVEAAVASPLELRACTTLDDFRQCVDLQKAVWGYTEEDLMPVRLFVTGSKIGGQVFGAFESNGRLVAFCLALPGVRRKITAVHATIGGRAVDCTADSKDRLAFSFPSPITLHSGDVLTVEY